MGWLWDVLTFPFSVPRYLRERRKMKLEIAQLEAATRLRDSRIAQDVSLDDLKRFDPKTNALLDRILGDRSLRRRRAGDVFGIGDRAGLLGRMRSRVRHLWDGPGGWKWRIRYRAYSIRRTLRRRR